MHLALCPADGGRRSDDLGANGPAIRPAGWCTIEFPGTEMVHGCLVQADQRTQRAADEVQFILDDQVGWT